MYEPIPTASGEQFLLSEPNLTAIDCGEPSRLVLALFTNYLAPHPAGFSGYFAPGPTGWIEERADRCGIHVFQLANLAGHLFLAQWWSQTEDINEATTRQIGQMEEAWSETFGDVPQMVHDELVARIAQGYVVPPADLGLAIENAGIE